MNKIEILSPAGGFDSVVAAVRSGADAVYIGAKLFSARAGAHNFDKDELRDCVRYCHERDVKVYLALNTLIFDDEMQEALNLAITAAEADIDAIIIQDLGLMSQIQRAIPDLPLHASTQMSVHTPYGAKALYEMGFKRVVVSRELSLSEIKEIRDFCPEVELEVFVHGALCMCVSGQCYFSAMLGGRSANRGMCAQPCRLPMQFAGNDHALSLKDNGSLGFLRELEKIGVRSAKIEGRMKRPEYVAAATAAAKQARDNGFVSPEAQEKLRSVFSRTGFTDGYLRGKLGAEMFGYRRKDDVVSADNKLLKEIRASYKDEAQRVPIRFHLRVKAGEQMALTVSDGTRETTVKSAEIAEKAVNLPLNSEKAAQSLQKTGNTPYYVKEITTDLDNTAAASAAALNSLRRDAIEALNNMREKRHNYSINPIEPEKFEKNHLRLRSKVRIFSQNLDFSEKFKDFSPCFVALNGLCNSDFQRLDALIADGYQIGVEAPRVMFGAEKEVYAQLKILREHGVTDLLAHNIAAAYIGRELGFTVHAGFGMNLANSWSLQWAKSYGIADAEVSVELSEKQIEALYKPIPVGMIRYGYFPLMICRNAPAGAPAGAPVGVNETCKTEQFLQDRKNEKFRVVTYDNYTEIYNCVPILMPQKDYKEIDGVFHMIRFSVENSVDNKEKILEKLRENHGFERFTHGLYTRGVKNFTIF